MIMMTCFMKKYTNFRYRLLMLCCEVGCVKPAVCISYPEKREDQYEDTENNEPCYFFPEHPTFILR